MSAEPAAGDYIRTQRQGAEEDAEEDDVEGEAPDSTTKMPRVPERTMAAVSWAVPLFSRVLFEVMG